MVHPKIRSIRIVKDDTILHVHGENAGAEGVWLGKGQVDGLYDAPVKTTWKGGAFQEGSTHRGTDKLHRDLILGFCVRDTNSSFELNDSRLRNMFEYELDKWDTTPTSARIEVETDLSGIRKLDVLMYEQPEFIPDLDPIMQQYGNCIFKLRAGDPMWYEDTVVSTFNSSGTVGTGVTTGTITASNPTDNVMYQKWVLTRGLWFIPDVEWAGPRGARVPSGANANRLIRLGLSGGAVGDYDRNELMWRDANNSNLLGQLGTSAMLVYPIPPYTPDTELLISVAWLPGGAMAQLWMPQRWSRPWGLELDSGSL
jgi:hypothetical protein